MTTQTVETAEKPTAKKATKAEAKIATVTPISPTASGYTVGTTVEVDPRTLLLVKNVRDATTDKGLVDSIRAVGVLEIITVLLTAEGGLQVKYGHRRTLAAIEADLPTVRVYIEATVTAEDDASAYKAAEVQRIITQRDENTHRIGLTASEDLRVVEDLALIGLSANQISKQARINRKEVDNALVVIGSEHTKANMAQFENLTLDQLAGLAEFEDDEDAYATLLRVASNWPGQFAHRLQQARDEREDKRLVAEATARLEAEGITVLATSPGRDNALIELRDRESGERLSVETHADCPGHACVLWTRKVLVDAEDNIVDESDVEQHQETLYAAAVDKARQEAKDAGQDPDEVDEDEVWDSIDAAADLGVTETRRAVPNWYCTEPNKNGHESIYGRTGSSTKVAAADMTDEAREAMKQARALVIANNKAWDSAEVVRREWLVEFAKRKTAPKGAGAFIATALPRDLHDLLDYQSTAAEDWLGMKVDKALTGASENRALHVALVQVLARYEKKIDRAAWREDGTKSRWGRYLRFLQSCGYTLSEVEEYAISKRTA